MCIANSIFGRRWLTPQGSWTTIEMQAITALAHLCSAVRYVMDVFEQCGQTLEQQHELFNNIWPLFVKKVSTIDDLRLHYKLHTTPFIVH